MAKEIDEPAQLAGGGPHGWVWEAMASGDLTAVRAAPPDFDVHSLHPKYGCPMTAFLQGMLNLDGRFLEGDRPARVRELVEELGRRGARPDRIIPAANLRVEGLYKSWQLRGELTALQAVIQMRNDYLELRWSRDGDAADVQEHITLLNSLIDQFAELAARSSSCLPRSHIPDTIVNIWERCRTDTAGADVQIVSPDGESPAHSLILKQASPVLAAMLASEMLEGKQRCISVDESVLVVDTFLNVLYCGCLPKQHEPQELKGNMRPGLKVVVIEAFKSSNERSRIIPAGSEGDVVNVDAKGDALVKFDNLPARQWVNKRNFLRLGTPSAAATDQLQEDLAGAFSLAQRWQVLGLSELLAERLERGLRVESLGVTLDVAVLHQAGRLRAACLTFAQNSGQVRARYEAGEYSQRALDALRHIFEGNGTSAAASQDEPEKKRRRQAV